MKKKLNTEAQFQVSKTKIFAFVKDENGKIHIVLGGYAASQKTFDNYEQAERYVNSKPWELLINVCSIILTKSNEKNENND